MLNFTTESVWSYCKKRAQPLTKTSIRNLLGGKGWPAHKVDKTLSPSVSQLSRKMWRPRRLTTLRSSTACYRDSFPSRIVMQSFEYSTPTERTYSTNAYFANFRFPVAWYWLQVSINIFVCYNSVLKCRTLVFSITIKKRSSHSTTPLH
jgi:hypothetical protein